MIGGIPFGIFAGMVLGYVSSIIVKKYYMHDLAISEPVPTKEETR